MRMSRKCQVCGRGPGAGNAVSHSNRHTRRRWLPNLQRVKIMLSGSPRRVYVCTGCIRSGRAQRVI